MRLYKLLKHMPSYNIHRSVHR